MSVEKTVRRLKAERAAHVVEILEVMPHAPKEKIAQAIAIIDEKQEETDRKEKEKKACCTGSSGLLAKVFGTEEKKKE